ncbi:hypothetical protein B0F90DRAFT_1821624 [Multifurca ochricompacta]|uniref:Uncharacterized protein n=1 Tax=Multifurca ochricompacta TaxID=376703 RepID=A0AAD4QKA8_9AGAM|nr:hypothetical protein B0F90DRAFT_1821624 [Multifurca ochricompacta]
MTIPLRPTNDIWPLNPGFRTGSIPSPRACKCLVHLLTTPIPLIFTNNTALVLSTLNHNLNHNPLIPIPIPTPFPFAVQLGFPRSPSLPPRTHPTTLLLTHELATSAPTVVHHPYTATGPLAHILIRAKSTPAPCPHPIPQPIPYPHLAPRRSRTLPPQSQNVYYHTYDAPRGAPTYVIVPPVAGGGPQQLRMQSPLRTLGFFLFRRFAKVQARTGKEATEEKQLLSFPIFIPARAIAAPFAGAD